MINILKDRLIHNDKIYIARSMKHRWGVFVDSDVEQYELLSETPVIRLSQEEITDNTIELYTYVFNDGDPFVPLGIAAMFNHDEAPNVGYIIDDANEIIRSYALTDLKAGTELFIHYGDENSEGFI